VQGFHLLRLVRPLRPRGQGMDWWPAVFAPAFLLLTVWRTLTACGWATTRHDWPSQIGAGADLRLGGVTRYGCDPFVLSARGSFCRISLRTPYLW